MDKECKVLPGGFIANAEEFMPGSNVFESEGKIYSDCTGIKEEDMGSRIVNVKKTARPIEPIDVGSIIIGTVEKNKEQGSFIKIIKAENNSEERSISNSAANLPVFNIANFYVNDIKDMLRIGDIVKAKVVEITPFSVVLGIKEPELGVVKAFCTKCRSALVHEGRDLKCNSCGSVETRKIASSYFSL